MKLQNILAAFGLMAITATGVLTGPAAFVPEDRALRGTEALSGGRGTAAAILEARTDADPRGEGVAVTTPAFGSTIRTGTPTFSGTGVPGAAIEVLDAAGELIAEKDVDTSGEWSVEADEAFVPGAHAGTVRQIDGTREASAAWSFIYVLVSDVAFTSPLDGEDVAMARPMFTGVGEPGAKVVVRIDLTGVVLIDTTVNEVGEWSQVSLRTLRKDSYSVTATQAFEGREATATLKFSYGKPIVAPVVDVKLMAPAIGATVRDARPVFSGTGETGAAIEVVEGANVIATATVADGTWAATPTTNVSVGAHAGVVNQNVAGAPQSSTPFSFTRAAVERPLVVTTPTIGGQVLTGGVASVRPVFTGTANPGADIRILGTTGSVLGTAKAHATTGAWSIVWTKSVLPARYVGGRTIQTVAGEDVGSVEYDFTVQLAADMRPLVVTSPAVGGRIPVNAFGVARPVFTGTATPGADVRVVTALGTNVGSTKADPSSGAWTITWSQTLLPGTYRGGSAVQSIGGSFIGSALYDFTVTARY